jgi:hypothetical protein
MCPARFWKYESLRTCIFDGLLSAQKQSYKEAASVSQRGVGIKDKHRTACSAKAPRG